MKKSLATLGLALLGTLLAPAPAQAGPATDALSACLADNTTGKERKDLVKWIFVSIAAHPELRELAVATPAMRDRVNQRTGVMLTRLLTDNCPEQARRAYERDGGQAFEAAFGVLGRLAMQELMTNADVNAAVSGFGKYVDKQKLEATFGRQ